MSGSQQKPLSPYTFYSAAKYWTQLQHQIEQTRTGDRILLMSMTFEPTEPAIAAVMSALHAAARRGAEVTLAIDAHSFLTHFAHDSSDLLTRMGRPGPLLTHGRLDRPMPPVFRNKLAILQDIESEPRGHGVIINKPSRRFNLPIAGRSHIKIAIINDQVFIGGCNLMGSTQVDMMVGFKDNSAADWLYGRMQKVIEAGHANRGLNSDQRLKVDDDTQVFIDSGVRGQSSILHEALALIDSAEKWLTITCQFFPNSITAKHLLAARRRGVKVEIIYTHPRYHGLVGGLGQQVSILRERSRIPKDLFQHALTRKDPMLHAKLIACDKGVMIGSHNYVQAGVTLGTAEIAFLNNNEALARAALNTLRNSLQTTKRI